MSDYENHPMDQQKSSRRRRWEVKSKEAFESSLAVEMESPNKVESKLNKQKCNLTKKERPKSSHINSSNKKNTNNLETYSNRDNIVSIKLSALLNDATNNSKEGKECQALRDSDENLIKSELKNCFETKLDSSEPTAPPLSPESSKEVNKTLREKNLFNVKNIHSGVILNSKITQQLNQFKEDIVEGKELAINKDSINIPNLTISGLMKGNVSTIYCERLNNFIITNQDQLLQPKKNEPLRDIRKKKTKKIYALFFQTGFRTFSVLCQGLLAGITIAHCLMV